MSSKQFTRETDDRGVYRAYGLQPGRYLVSVGFGQSINMLRFGYGGYYKQTFYPNTTDETKAAAVEVGEGTEATGIDIALDRPTQTFTATGRVVDAESGEPVADVPCGYGLVQSNGHSSYVTSFGSSGARTDAQGNFRLDGLMPNRYAAFVMTSDDGNSTGDFYSEPAPFEVTNANVTGLEFKMRRRLRHRRRRRTPRLHGHYVDAV